MNSISNAVLRTAVSRTQRAGIHTRRITGARRAGTASSLETAFGPAQKDHCDQAFPLLTPCPFGDMGAEGGGGVGV